MHAPIVSVFHLDVLVRTGGSVYKIGLKFYMASKHFFGCLRRRPERANLTIDGDVTSSRLQGRAELQHREHDCSTHLHQVNLRTVVLSFSLKISPAMRKMKK